MKAARALTMVRAEVPDQPVTWTIVPGTSTVTMNGSAGQTIGGSVTTPLFNLVVADALGDDPLDIRDCKILDRRRLEDRGSRLGDV